MTSHINTQIAVLFAMLFVTTNETKQIKTKYISQPLDHSTNNSLTWRMRYFERKTYWKPRAPIYIYIGGEFEAPKLFLRRGGMVRLARSTGGAMFVTEHRFYGGSVPPHVDGSDRFEHLNSRQALADLSRFVKMLKSERDFMNSKVVVIGVSYSGCLATWLRRQYPDLIDAAWASSAPLLAELDFRQYYEGVGRLYRKHGGDVCHDNIKKLFHYQTLLFDQSKTEELKREQHICDSASLERDVYFENYISRFSNRNSSDIVNICFLISNFTIAKRSFHILEHSNDLMKLRQENTCAPESFRFVLSRDPNDLAWAWQCCSEFGYFMTTSSQNQPFGNNISLEYLAKKCSKNFGRKFNLDFIRNQIESTNKLYGGKFPNVTKVVFVSGADDPWSGLGVFKDFSQDAPLVLIKDAGHGEDFKPARMGDSMHLKVARVRIEGLLKKWIA